MRICQLVLQLDRIIHSAGIRVRVGFDRSNNHIYFADEHSRKIIVIDAFGEYRPLYRDNAIQHSREYLDKTSHTLKSIIESEYGKITAIDLPSNGSYKDPTTIPPRKLKAKDIK